MGVTVLFPAEADLKNDDVVIVQMFREPLGRDDKGESSPGGGRGAKKKEGDGATEESFHAFPRKCTLQM